MKATLCLTCQIGRVLIATQLHTAEEPVRSSLLPSATLPVQGLWEAAENILNTIVLPPAIDDAGGAGVKNYDYTQVNLTRSYLCQTRTYKEVHKVALHSINNFSRCRQACNTHVSHSTCLSLMLSYFRSPKCQRSTKH